jgi:hypothetical protein
MSERGAYQAGVEGETVTGPRLVFEMLYVVAHEWNCGCVKRGRERFVCGCHLAERKRGETG